MIWNKEAECANPETKKQQQSKNLKDLIQRVWDNVPFYRKKLEDAGLKPGDIKSIDDISKLPFTSKDELRTTYPFGLFAVPQKDIVEIHTSSGTTGKPVVGAYTEKDMDDWGEVMARTLAMAGADSHFTVQNAYGYGLFTGGFGVHYGAHKIGSKIVPISSGNTKRQLMMMEDFKTDLITCTPSYALYMAETAAAEGIDLKKLNLKSGCFGAEPWSNSMRDEIESLYGIKAYDIYGLTEIIGPGVASECEAQDGLHINDDLFFPEIIDPETGESLPLGSKGELVFTTLTKEGSPIIRYRTRDLTYLMPEKCDCGRTTLRMHRLIGRTDDMLVLRGVNVFPSQIENLLIKIEGTKPHYQIVVDRTMSHLDDVELMVEVEPAFFSDETKELEKLQKKIEYELKSELGISVKVHLVEPKSIARSEGKAKRIIDKRKL